MFLPHISDQEISKDEVKRLEVEGRDYCVCHGMIHRDSRGNFEHIPFTLYPSPVPQKLFTAAREVQTDFNLLVHKVSQDFKFTKKALMCTVAADPFTSKLFDIYDKVWQLGSAQPISLGIFRSDYFIETSSGLHDEYRSSSIQPASNDDTDLIHIKQVELNTMSLGGTTFACLVPELHRYLLRLVGRQESKVPPNNALDELADGLIKAWELYAEASAVIMFIVDPDEWNVYCQRILEYRIKERNSAVGVIRRSLTDIFNNSEANKNNNGSLFIDGLEVAVAYFRAGYAPKHYPSEKEWSARLTLELSRCIKCPTVAYQLIGTKKMQQVLAGPGILERFLPDKDSVDRVRKTFTGLHTLDLGPEGDHNMESCLKMVEKFVLKPQREGGGNNIFREDIRHTLLRNPESRSQYILMDRIQPEISKNLMVRHELPGTDYRDVIPELGILGIIISRGDEILLNKEIGYMLRTKTTEHDEGGISSGSAAFDSPYMM